MSAYRQRQQSRIVPRISGIKKPGIAPGNLFFLAAGLLNDKPVANLATPPISENDREFVCPL